MEFGSVKMEESEAARALAGMQGAKVRLAGRAHWSFARHAVVGLVLGALVGGAILPPGWWILVEAACFLVMAAVVMRDRARDGFFVNGYRAGPTRWIAVALALFVLGALLGAVRAAHTPGWEWGAPALGVTTAIVATLASMMWERVYRRELAGERE